ncbi:MAG: Gfo/Idh/MocA family oxidoreductase [Oscillospiraceae bacterium]|nr:Gfo/Idh/MocA family oxidoreductase [Oscillospiraceae bacterium]
MGKIRYGLIGCGRIASSHIAAALSNEDEIEISGLCDTNIGAAKALAEKYALKAPVYETPEKLFASEKIELAAIATPSGSHGELALQAVRNGCHVLVEKPLALSLGQADRLLQEAARQGVWVGVCHQKRFNRAAALAKTLAESGKLGELSHGAAVVRWSRDKSYYDLAPWRGTWEQDGGAMMNQCIHAADLLCWLLGEPKSVRAWTANRVHRYIEAEDLGIAVVEFQNGILGTLEGTTAVYPENMEETLSLFGSSGTIKMGGKAVERVEILRCAALGREEETRLREENSEGPPNIYGFGHRPLYYDMARAIREKRPPAVDGAAGRRALELVLGVYRSAAEGREVHFPLDGGSTTKYKRIW